jgi:putative ABC transport system permease protein
MGPSEIGLGATAAYHALLLVPLALMLWLKIPMIGETLLAVVRMGLQLCFVGLYLELVFRLNDPWLNGLWLLVMILVADASVLRGAGLRFRPFALPLVVSLAVGTAIPLLAFLGPLLRGPTLLDARYVIPIGGMILGNCLRANIIGVRSFYSAIQRGAKPYQLSLVQGARLDEAIRPYLREAFQAALSPTVATIATIGLVALPGMMTGVILGGADPMTAIQYQIAIMIAILTGTAVTVTLAILLSARRAFGAYGTLRPELLRGIRS